MTLCHILQALLLLSLAFSCRHTRFSRFLFNGKRPRPDARGALSAAIFLSTALRDRVDNTPRNSSLSARSSC